MAYSNTTAPQLAEDEIHIWLINPLQHTEAATLEKYRAYLPQEEKDRIDRYKFPKHQHDALITRIFSRDILAKYLNCTPQEINFSKGEHGKPDLFPTQKLKFNLSHTDSLIVCAISQEAELGIDCEHVDRNNDILNIADRYFSADEIKELFSLPEDQQRSRFFDYWTLKESYIKACGQGLAIPLDHFSFHINDEEAHYTSNQIKTDICLSFSTERDDTPALWHSWLCYPSSTHRLALSIKNDSIKTSPQLKFFNSTPLGDFKEIKLDQHSLFV